MKETYLNDKFFSRLETLSFNLKTELRGYFGGRHLVRSYGQTVEFSDYREYRLGDDIRRIDWNLYSRFEKYYLKLFTDERQMKVQIFIDCSASMGKDNSKKQAYAVATAAAIGYLAVHNMDKVTFNFMSGKHAENPFGTIVGKNAFMRAISGFDEINFEGEDADIRACVTSDHDISRGNGLTVIISDFFTEYDWKAAVDYLLYMKRQVLLVQIMTPDEADPTYDGRVSLFDAEAVDASDPKNMKLRITRSMQKAYEEALNDFIADIKNFCNKRGVQYVLARTDRPIEKVLFGQMIKVGIME
ncbi:MAG: DUF58 domain-containing protein [Clostridia bacterium]|nr:DUF58 domain-containing protein [Clostridia bacterium]